MPCFRPRLSLLTALLLTTLVGMAIVIAQLWREVGPLRAEVVQLRNETGRLSIDVPSNLYAVEVRPEAERSWKWRVWVPKAEKAVLNLQWGDVPEKGVPSPHNTMLMGSGEHWVTLSVVRDDVSGRWLSYLATDIGSFSTVIQPHEHWFDEPEKFYGVENGVSYETEAAKPNTKTLVLKRFRADQVDSADKVTDKPTVGFIIWLERQ